MWIMTVCAAQARLELSISQPHSGWPLQYVSSLCNVFTLMTIDIAMSQLWELASSVADVKSCLTSNVPLQAAQSSRSF